MASTEGQVARIHRDRDVLESLVNLTSIWNGIRQSKPTGLALLVATYRTLVRYPLLYAYIHGPRVRLLGMDVGGWGGLSAFDACAELTGVTASHWLDAPEQCYHLLHQRVHGLEVVGGGFIYCWMLISIMRALPALGHRIFQQLTQGVARLHQLTMVGLTSVITGVSSDSEACGMEDEEDDNQPGTDDRQ